MAISMTYGSYSFSPVPTVVISKEYIKNGAKELIGQLYTLTLNGFITTLGAGNGLVTLDARMEALSQALSCDCDGFTITCDGQIVIQAYPRIVSLSFGESSDNWTTSVPYTLVLEYESELSGGMGICSSISGQPVVRSTQENWTLEPVDDSYASYFASLPGYGNDGTPYQFRLTHNISAVGTPVCTSGSMISKAWEQARSWVLPRLGFDVTIARGSGSHNLGSLTDLSPFNHSRVQTTDEQEGSYTVVETWLMINQSGTGVAGKAIEDFTCDIQTSLDNPFKQVSVQGTIQGLETVTYGTGLNDSYQVLQSKYNAASGYWSSMSGRIYYRANAFSNLTLNTAPLNTTVGHNPTRGVISYSNTYDTRPSNCFTGVGYDVKTESIVVSDTNPTDVFASITVLGRTCGPVLQDIATKTAGQRQVQIDMIVSPADGCPSSGNINSLFTPLPRSAVSGFITNVQNDLTSNHGSVFKTADNETWEYKLGRYSRTVAWTYGDCC